MSSALSPSIGTQTLAIGAFERHLASRARGQARRKRNVVAGLMLTSMVDMFSLLVIFLLQTFSTSPELMTITKGVTLPTASSAQSFRDAPVLSISMDGVYLDQKWIGKPADVLADPSPFSARLSQLKELWTKAHPGAGFAGRITLQADRDLPSPIVAGIMGLLPSLAYSTVQLAVVSGGGR